METGGQPARRAGVRRLEKARLKTDMTPMVDLGFLLITFFVFTTTISTPHETTLIIPKDPTITTPPVHIGETVVLTILLGADDKIVYYHGDWDQAFSANRVGLTGFDVNNGLGQVIRDKQVALDENGKIKNGRKEMMLIIKPGERSEYKNLIDALDEVMINKVGKYAIVDISQTEESYLKSH